MPDADNLGFIIMADGDGERSGSRRSRLRATGGTIKRTVAAPVPHDERIASGCDFSRAAAGISTSVLGS
ncbi:hypothetical protein SD70_02265 [Gordoniibacillus kamchatkensis]|uniref:Uncharacterized protein n=1 Tax=Gordoniibacillus kamchatkensis TaxID=1590651 RepID=A0ABR5AMV8_9BACL|nr:hypothetical protein SD70_02265 [Paenibacillus sp. VKM B-2647]